MEHFTCPISQEIFVDPVILVESGHTYERKIIEEWFHKKKGKIEPLTGKKLKKWPPVLVPNIIVRQAVEEYREQRQTSHFATSTSTEPSVPVFPPPQSRRSSEASSSTANAPGGADTSVSPSSLSGSSQNATPAPDPAPVAGTTSSTAPESSVMAIAAPAADPCPTNSTPQTMVAGFSTPPPVATSSAHPVPYIHTDQVAAIHWSVQDINPGFPSPPPSARSSIHPVPSSQADEDAAMAAAIRLSLQDAHMSDTADSWRSRPQDPTQASCSDTDLDLAIQRSLRDVRVSVDRDPVGQGRDARLDAGIASSLRIASPEQLHELDENHNTPLHLAVQSGHQLSLQVLLERGVNINARNKDGWTALHMAAVYCTSSDEPIWQTLLDKGASLVALDKDDNTPLHLAVRNRHDALVTTLVLHAVNQRGKKGCAAVLNMQNKDGNTALHLAAQNGASLKMVSLLVKHRCNMKLVNKAGHTARKLADNAKHKQLSTHLATEQALSSTSCTLM